MAARDVREARLERRHERHLGSFLFRYGLRILHVQLDACAEW
jgi:hypothetical protein